MRLLPSPLPRVALKTSRCRERLPGGAVYPPNSQRATVRRGARDGPKAAKNIAADAEAIEWKRTGRDGADAGTGGDVRRASEAHQLLIQQAGRMYLARAGTMLAPLLGGADAISGADNRRDLFTAAGISGLPDHGLDDRLSLAPARKNPWDVRAAALRKLQETQEIASGWDEVRGRCLAPEHSVNRPGGSGPRTLPRPISEFLPCVLSSKDTGRGESNNF